MEKMTHDYIRQTIPEEISERGGALLRLVGGKTVPLETSIKEAKQAGYVLGDEELVKRQFEGLVKCMRDGTEADGMARQIGGWVTVYPVFVGPIDLSRGFDPEKNGVRIRMRLLNEIDVDITDWEFRDVTPGRTPFTLDSASTGELVNTVKIGDPIHVNGRPFPSHDVLRVDWAVEGTDKRGTIPAEKFASDATLITIAADALAELDAEEYDGKTIDFTVRGNFASAKISATLKYVPPVPIDETSDGKVAVYAATDGGQSETFTYGHTWTLDGKGFCVGPELSGWAIGSVIVHTPDSNSYMLDLDWTPSADGRTLTLEKSDSAMPISAGEYPGSKIKVNLIYDPEGAATEETLEIPIDFVVED